MSAEVRQRRGAPSRETPQHSSDAHHPPTLPPPPSITSLKRLETISNLLSPSTPASSFTSPPTLLFFILAFLVLLPIRSLSALFTPIQDCDETFNYWEPTHFLLHGHGMQTWEYSPQYALRSYLYILLHAVPIRLFQLLDLTPALTPLLGEGKIAEFYFMRLVLALISSLCEAWLCYAIACRMRRSIAVVTLLLLASSAGMFHASVAFLPSSFAMYTVMLTYASWMRSEYPLTILFTGITTLIGWPFASVLSIPLALDILIRYRRQLHIPILYAIVTLIITLTPSLLIDYHYYHRALIATLNIFLYNSSSTHGSSLYGVAPASYYVHNLLLNLNVVSVLGVAGPVIGVGYWVRWRAGSDGWFVVWMMGMVGWLLGMMMMPHKEERFMFVIYPLLCFSAAYAIVQSLLLARLHLCSRTDDDEELSPRFRSSVKLSLPLGRWSLVALALLLLVIALISTGRVLALVLYYSAPFHVYSHLTARVSGQSNLFTSQPTNPFADHSVCVGKEWYRFPSHFFLPSPSPHSNFTTTLHLHYLPSSFTGLLPGHFPPSPHSMWHKAHSTRLTPTDQNDENRQEPGRYLRVERCEWIVDLVLEGQREAEYGGMRMRQEGGKGGGGGRGEGCRKEWVWRVVGRWRFLDAEKSAKWSRVVWLPWWGQKGNKWGEYQLIERDEEEVCT